MYLEILTLFGPGKHDTLEQTPTYGKFCFGPFDGGTGSTVGTVLREALLNGVEGAAPVAWRSPNLAGDHRTLDGVRESTSHLAAKIAQLAVAAPPGGDVWLHADVRGPLILTGHDFIGPSGVRVFNRDLELATVTPGARLLLGVLVRRGCGSVYKRQIHRVPDGAAALDATFSPVKRASYTVGRRRLGGRDRDAVIVDVWTNGAVSPAAALSAAIDAIKTQLTALVGMSPDGSDRSRPPA
jgi:DNA-directed RNA polymerase subunit alpha